MLNFAKIKLLIDNDRATQDLLSMYSKNLSMIIQDEINREIIASLSSTPTVFVKRVDEE